MVPARPPTGAVTSYEANRLGMSRALASKKWSSWGPRRDPPHGVHGGPLQPVVEQRLFQHRPPPTVPVQVEAEARRMVQPLRRWGPGPAKSGVGLVGQPAHPAVGVSGEGVSLRKPRDCLARLPSMSHLPEAGHRVVQPPPGVASGEIVDERLLFGGHFPARQRPPLGEGEGRRHQVRGRRQFPPARIGLVRGQGVVRVQRESRRAESISRSAVSPEPVRRRRPGLRGIPQRTLPGQPGAQVVQGPDGFEPLGMGGRFQFRRRRGPFSPGKAGFELLDKIGQPGRTAAAGKDGLRGPN